MSQPPNVFSRTLTAMRRNRPGLLIVSSFVNILLLVTSIYMLQIYDRVLASGSLDTLLWLTVVAVVAIAIYGLLEQSRRLILARSAAFVDRELSAPVLQHSMEKRLAGEPAEAGIRDVSDLRNFYQGDAVLAFFDAPWSLVFIAFVWVLHPMLGAIVLGGAIVLFLATLTNDVLTRRRQNEAARTVREANDAAIRYVDGGETISPLGMAPALFSRWREWQNLARAEQAGLGETTTTVLNFTRAFRMAVQIAVLGAGAYLVLAGQITPGVMIAASIIGMRALAPIQQLTAAWHKFVAARAARSSLANLFKEIDETPEHVELPRPSGALSIEDVTILAGDTRKPILNAVNFDLEPGQICAVIGPSGAGKSTLCRAIVGSRRPHSGAVRLDGADTHSWAADKLGAYLGYLPQKVELFPGTVAENIGRFGDGPGQAILDAATLAGADQFVLRLPNGFETSVGRTADQLSQGQQQRIGLARALYGDPALVVLDEPNSNLDRAGDTALVEALQRLKERGTTVVIVSHRSEVLKAVDKVLVLRDGAVAKFCDRDEMMRPKPQEGETIKIKPLAPTAKSQTVSIGGIKARTSAE